MKKYQPKIVCICWGRAIVFLIIGIILVIFFPLLQEAYNKMFPATYTVTDEPITIQKSGYHPANNRQYEASVQMTVYNEKLYFSPVIDPSQKNRTLYVFENTSVVPVTELSYEVTAMEDGFVYYSSENDASEWLLYCYDIATGETVSLMPMNRTAWGLSIDWRGYYFTADSTYYIKSEDIFYPVNGRQVGKPVEAVEQYSLGNRTYYIDDWTIFCISADGTSESLAQQIPNNQKCIIPCDGGLLIHNEYRGNFLHFIEEESGEVVELFAVPCIYSISTVNVHGNHAYLSFKRYEKEGLLGGLKRYRSDTLEGTYRIDLTDYSVEKISDAIYDGLFIFDDSGIYACDDLCNIYKLDFDGNVILTLLEK